MKVRNKVVMLVMTMVIVLGTFLATLYSDNRPVLGLDLQGGISIGLTPVKGQDLSALDTAVDIIRNRVDGLGIAEPEVNRQGNTIVVDLPGVKDRAKAQSLVGQTAELRFRHVLGCIPPPDRQICSTQPPPESLAKLDLPTDSSSTTAPADASSTTVPADASSTTVSGSSMGGETISTAPIAVVRPAQAVSTTAAPTTAAPSTTVAPTTAGGSTTTTTVPSVAQLCAKLVAKRDENLATAKVWLPMRDENNNGKADDGCEYLDASVMTGRDIKSAKSVYNNGWQTDIAFKNDDFVNLVATPFVREQVAVELDGVVESSPTINEGITGRNVTISGNFSQGEAKDLALVLKYGSLPVQFDPDEQTVSSVSPTLGKDQLHAGIVSGIVGLALVAIYMIVYYRLLGVVVWVGLALTGLIFFTIVSYLSANRGLTLTLAGVTGIIVSVGITVDSYVVYFERLKDEVRTGKTVRSSLDSGFKKAFRTIVAADLVSLIGAVVLYVFATGGVRGFAFFLGLSTVIDLLIAYFFMHPAVFLLARRPQLVRLPGVGIAAALDVKEAQA